MHQNSVLSHSSDSFRIEDKEIFHSIVRNKIRKALFLNSRHINHITLGYKFRRESISQCVIFVRILSWDIEIFWCYEGDLYLREIAKEERQRMNGTTISQISHKSHPQRFIGQNIRKMLRDSVEIEKSLCRMFSRAISCINNWHS